MYWSRRVVVGSVRSEPHSSSQSTWRWRKRCAFPPDDKVPRLIEHPEECFAIPHGAGTFTHIEITMFAGQSALAMRRRLPRWLQVARRGRRRIRPERQLSEDELSCSAIEHDGRK